MTSPRCRYPDRDRRLADEASGAAGANPDAAWEAHCEACLECAEEAAYAAAVAAALDPVDEDTAPSEEEGPVRARGRRRLAVGLLLGLAAAAVVASLAPWRVGEPPASAPDDGPARSAYTAAWDHAHAARFPEALAEAREALRLRRDRATLFQTAFCLAHLGRHAEALPLYVAAEAAPDTPGLDGTSFETWYVVAHRAQSVAVAAADPAADAVVVSLLQGPLAGPGLARSRSRALLWLRLLQERALRRGDVAASRQALAELEAENRTHRREAAADPSTGTEEDCHYALEGRFFAAQVLDADAAAARDAAAALRRTKAATAERASPARSADFLADGCEDEALVELLVARRGEPADLQRAESLLRRARALRAASGNVEGRASASMKLAWTLLLRGEPSAAVATAAEAETIAITSGLGPRIADARLVRLQALVVADRTTEARRLLAETSATTASDRDPGRQLAWAAVAWRLADDPAARAAAASVLDRFAASPLADLRAVARRVRTSDDGSFTALGPLDLGYRP